MNNLVCADIGQGAELSSSLSSAIQCKLYGEQCYDALIIFILKIIHHITFFFFHTTTSYINIKYINK